MKFRVTCELDYLLLGPVTFLFALKCIQTGGQRILSESMETTPSVPMEDFTLSTGMNRFSRLRTYRPGTISLCYRAEVSTRTRVVAVSSIIAEEAGNVDPEALPYLFPSRYCPSDRLRQQALELFGHLSEPLVIAAAVSDWIYDNIAYVSGSSGENCWVLDTLEQRQGVCRDFAHLGIAFCRALNVPARYATCYAYQLEPPDFHACFEIFSGGWFVFDPTRLAPLNGLVRIATGRDAADAAICNIFGDLDFTRSAISCECLDSGFVPATRDSLMKKNEALALL
jgi:hypothetical protein